ncbi:MAG: hypothetical protein R2877_03015 [Bdellovibrionota bacterium]
MGFKPSVFAGGRTDDWEADHVYWGSEKKWLEGKRRDAKEISITLWPQFKWA